MTPEEQRIAIAEALGRFKRPPNQIVEYQDPRADGVVFQRVRFLNKDGTVERVSPCYIEDIPNYPEDLDACHEMEKAIKTQNEFSAYVGYLIVITGDQLPVSASAAQRCEAFCRVMWPERWGK